MRRPTLFITIVASIAAFALSSVAVSAADMAVKAKALPLPAPVMPWTGWYVGLNAGGVVDSSRGEQDPAGCFLTGCGVGGVAANPFRTFILSGNQAGFTGGGQAGYNWQAESWVFGLEGDINYSGARKSISSVLTLTGPLTGAFPVVGLSEKMDWFGTFRGRVGFLPAPQLLLFATGGLAYGHVSSSSNVLFPVTCCGGDQYVGNASTVRAGWTVGGGGEWMIAPQWSVKAEYLYVDLGKTSYADPCVTPTAVCGAPFPSYSTSVTTREHVARVGVNYHFGAPVVAKY